MPSNHQLQHYSTKAAGSSLKKIGRLLWSAFGLNEAVGLVVRIYALSQQHGVVGDLQAERVELVAGEVGQGLVQERFDVGFGLCDERTGDVGIFALA